MEFISWEVGYFCSRTTCLVHMNRYCILDMNFDGIAILMFASKNRLWIPISIKLMIVYSLVIPPI